MKFCFELSSHFCITLIQQLSVLYALFHIPPISPSICSPPYSKDSHFSIFLFLVPSEVHCPSHTLSVILL